MNNLIDIAERFKSSGLIDNIREYGSGNINKTFLVTLSAPEQRFILQRINTQVFRQPELVMRNMRVVTEHIRQRLQLLSFKTGHRWNFPKVLFTQNGNDHWIAPNGSFWRALNFIESARSFDVVRNAGHAKEAGYALGMFHNLLNDLPSEKLADTLKGYHITPQYLLHYDKVLVTHDTVKSPEMNYCVKFIEERRAWAYVLENAKAEGKLADRIIHGDPKINNFMIDDATGLAVSLVDLDTVKPGLIHYDIGDCLRSACNSLGEETENPESVSFDTDLCHAIMRGYLSTAGEFLTEDDFDYLYDSIRLIAFELGLRFFTDYLEGNVYFNFKHPEHNLNRALVQFKLTESIETHEKTIRDIIKEHRFPK